MSDGISIPPSPAQPQQKQAAPELAKVVSLPPDLPPNKPVSGVVVANEKGLVSIKTDQGIVVVEADIDAEIGQKINLRLQVVTQQAKQAMIAELLSVLPDKGVSDKAPLPGAKSADAVLVHSGKALSAFTPLQARLVALPDVIGDETMPVLLRSLLKLPALAELPPTIKEGLAKFQMLVGLLGQANLLPAQSLQASSAHPEWQKGLLTALQQLLAPEGGKISPLVQQPGQNFIQLQTILPGQTISPDILLNVRQQLLAILQPQTAQPSGQPLFTMPALGVVLGQATTSLPGLSGGNLVFMATPQGQQLIGVLSAQQMATPDKALLPGTVIVTAFEPQVQKTVTLPVMPVAVLADELLSLSPLNLSLGDRWPALEQIVDQALAQASTQPELLKALRQVLPTPVPQQFPAALLFFFAVLKNGFSDQWVSENALKVLEKTGKGSDLLKQLSGDMRLLQAGMNDDLPVDAWRPLPVPLQVGEQLMRLQFYYRYPEDGRQGDDEEQSARKNRKTRFLLNVPKTSFGDVQIDGLVQDKDLEMILRTEEILPSAIEGAIRQRYQSVLETTGMHGGIDFQSGAMHFVRV